MIKRPYAPGMKGKRRKGAPSEYGKELKEKQKLKWWYNLREAQFKKYVKEVLQKSKNIKRGDAVDAGKLLIKKLESRLDNVIFRLGLASSRSMARQLVSHGHFLVNNRSVNIPSFQVDKGDEIKVKPEKAKKKSFQNVIQSAKKQPLPAWLQLNPQTLEAKVVEDPMVEPENLPAEISAIFEFYSR